MLVTQAAQASGSGRRGTRPSSPKTKRTFHWEHSRHVLDRDRDAARNLAAQAERIPASARTETRPC